MSLPVIILGAGGHAKVLIEALCLCKAHVLGMTDPSAEKIGTNSAGITVLGNDEVLSHYQPGKLLLVNGIGSVGLPTLRMTVFEKFKKLGFSFATVIHPSAVIASDVILGEGAQIMAGVVIQPGSRIGYNTIINTRASIDHDCDIGEHVHISPGVILSGGICIGNAVHIGTGTVVIQGLKIGNGSLVGAGSVVLNDLPDNSKFMNARTKS